MPFSRTLSAILFVFTLDAFAFAEDKAADIPGFQNYRVSDYIHWYPAIEQHRMMSAWLKANAPGSWTHTGRVDADDRTVITPQADSNYGYCWFNLSNGPLTIELPAYERYSSLSVFDMNHFVEAILVSPTKPVVVRLAGQRSPVDDAHEVVLRTNSGLAFLRMVIPEAKDEQPVLNLTKQIKTVGGDGTEPFIIPDFTPAEREAALALVEAYSRRSQSGNKLFGKTSQGVGDLDRAKGVLWGQLGIPARYVQYTQYRETADGGELGGSGHYEITVNPEGLFRDDRGYWSVTIYSLEDRYLIPNAQSVYSVTSYNAVANENGSYTVRINPEGGGANAIPTAGKTIYAIMRVYQPKGVVDFPSIREVKNPERTP